MEQVGSKVGECCIFILWFAFRFKDVRERITRITTYIVEMTLLDWGENPLHWCCRWWLLKWSMGLTLGIQWSWHFKRAVDGADKTCANGLSKNCLSFSWWLDLCQKCWCSHWESQDVSRGHDLAMGMCLPCCQKELCWCRLAISPFTVKQQEDLYTWSEELTCGQATVEQASLERAKASRRLRLVSRISVLCNSWRLTPKTSLTSEGAITCAEAEKPWKPIDMGEYQCPKPPLFTLSQSRKMAPGEGPKIGANSTKATKICKVGHWFPKMSMDQGCESNTPPLVLLDLWSQLHYQQHQQQQQHHKYQMHIDKYIF